MATIEFTSSTTQPLNAFPLSQAPSWTNWNTKRVPMPGSAGFFSCAVDTGVDGKVWLIFEGDAVPSSWDDWVGKVDLGLTTVLPVAGVAPNRGGETTIDCFFRESIDVVISTTTDLTAIPITFVVENRQTRADKLVIENAGITKTASTITVGITTAITDKVGDYVWSVRKVADDSVLLHGPLRVRYAPKKDGP